MSSTTFVNNVTPIVADWLNDVNNAAYVTVPANTADIATNTADIATNAADIATNTADIATKANLNGTNATGTWPINISGNAATVTNATTTTPIKLQCRVATTGPFSLGAPGATFDGVTMALGDRILNKDTTPASANGIWIWNGASVPVSRATDADSAGDLLGSMLVAVSEGTANGNSLWMLTTDDPITIGTTELTFERKDAGSIPQGIPQNSQSANYTTVLADANTHLLHPSADTTARTFTIDSNANVPYPIGTAITFVNQNAAGVLTIAITTDTMRLAGAGTTGSRTLAANGIATALKITATEWIISGTGLT